MLSFLLQLFCNFPGSEAPLWQEIVSPPCPTTLLITQFLAPARIQPLIRRKIQKVDFLYSTHHPIPGYCLKTHHSKNTNNLFLYFFICPIPETAKIQALLKIYKKWRGILLHSTNHLKSNTYSNTALLNGEISHCKNNWKNALFIDNVPITLFLAPART